MGIAEEAAAAVVAFAAAAPIADIDGGSFKTDANGGNVRVAPPHLLPATRSVVVVPDHGQHHAGVELGVEERAQQHPVFHHRATTPCHPGVEPRARRYPDASLPLIGHSADASLPGVGSNHR